MTLVRVPKKLRDVFALLRKGHVDRGLDQLDAIEGFEPHKAVARAEIAYFRHELDRAMDLDEQGLPFHDQWYAGNVVDEHFVAYVRAAQTLARADRARRFLRAFLKREKGLRVPASDRPRHQFHVERYQREIGQLLARLEGKQQLAAYPPAYEEPAEAAPMETFVEQLGKYRPKVPRHSLEGAQYMLHFLYETGRAADFLSIYEKFSGRIDYLDHHLHAAKIYVARKRPERARDALRQMTTKAWYAVEEMQVAPMQLWAHDDLQSILTPKFCRELLSLPKGRG